MNDIAIRVEGLSKQYQIGGRQERYKTLRDALTDTFMSPLRRIGKVLHGQAPGPARANETIWALRDLSFEVKHGEVVGIIGRNGSGKSTLLKILSRITEPTCGFAEVDGRLGSLLEVGTGFHPELTGRENLYLNGSILGMKRVEIDRKFDEIVAFAEVERFIDTPVKHYSSGMYLRLAFAVAAHLDPELLLVDEVLAVGDIAFQKRCLQKMGSVAKEGRTVLFVSHNMAAVLSLCQKGFLLDAGRLVAHGVTQDVVDKYMQTGNEMASTPLTERVDRGGSQIMKLVAYELRNSIGQPITRAYSGQDVALALGYQARTGSVLKNVYAYIIVYGRFGEPLFQLSTGVSGSDFETVPSRGTLLCDIPRLPLQPGIYQFSVYCRVGGEDADWVPSAGTIEVEAGDFFGTGKLPPLDRGPYLVQHSWRVE